MFAFSRGTSYPKQMHIVARFERVEGPTPASLGTPYLPAQTISAYDHDAQRCWILEYMLGRTHGGSWYAWPVAADGSVREGDAFPVRALGHDEDEGAEH